GCILSGSAMLKGLEVKIAKSVSKTQYKLCGRDKPANLIKNLTFGEYEKPFKKEKRVNAWLNRNVEECEKYNADPMCNYTMSIAFYKNFFDGLSKIYDEKRLEAIDKKLPIFIVSGDKDPVGKMGKAVAKLYRMYKTIGIEDAQIKLYPQARHEIVNELNKDEVYADVSAWLDGVIEKNK
ncbi:MAG: lysophospholipase, partial [Clostridia bacterium]|nr:lysophospholipase [Clostridia bacterium]